MRFLSMLLTLLLESVITLSQCRLMKLLLYLMLNEFLFLQSQSCLVAGRGEEEGRKERRRGEDTFIALESRFFFTRGMMSHKKQQQPQKKALVHCRTNTSYCTHRVDFKKSEPSLGREELNRKVSIVSHAHICGYLSSVHCTCSPTKINMKGSLS